MLYKITTWAMTTTSTPSQCHRWSKWHRRECAPFSAIWKLFSRFKGRNQWRKHSMAWRKPSVLLCCVLHCARARFYSGWQNKPAMTGKLTRIEFACMSPIARNARNSGKKPGGICQFDDKRWHGMAVCIVYSTRRIYRFVYYLIHIVALWHCSPRQWLIPCAALWATGSQSGQL